jgi:hypothetical protein
MLSLISPSQQYDSRFPARKFVGNRHSLGSVAQIVNATIVQAGLNGGSGELKLRNSIIQNVNYSLVQDDGLNMQWQSNCQNSMPARNPLLFSNNGGPTPTNALHRKSPAIDAIALPDCIDQDGTPIAIDQRGFTRPRLTACDIGAFELQRKRSRTR